MPLIGRIAAATARAYGLFSSIAQAVDPYFNYVVALLHGDGTNGGQNNTFLDSSTNNFTITRNGNTTQGSFSPFSQTGWGNYFDGNGDELTLSNTTAAQVGSGDFSIECFVFPTRQTNTYAQGLITYGIVGSTTGTSYIGFQMSSSGYLNLFLAQTASPDLADPNLLPINQWSHVVACRSGSTLSMFVNGLRVATTTTSATVGSSGDRITIGGQWFANASTRQLQGYISNARIVKGSSAYSASSSTLTVPTAPLTAITNTSLLTCQSNRFIDNSTNAFAITANGDVSAQPFSPFNPTTAYSTSSIGGSGYFDGSGDYLDVANNNTFDTNSTFTLECFFYQPSSGNATFFSRGGGTADWNTSTGHQFLLFIDTGTLYWMWNNSGTNTQISTTAPAAGQWHHIAVGYNGTTTRFWLNGASVGTSTTGYTLPTTRNIVRAGLNPSGQNPLTGYESNLRFVKGTDVYGVGNTTITVPTAPLTAITNTSLLLNYTNGAIFDNAAVADYETVGNAQISTSVKKYGTGSMSFDGTGDYLVTDAPSTNLFAFGTGDFTIEFWIYFNTVSGNQSLVDLRPSGVNGAYPLIYASSTSLTYYVSSASQINGGVMATGIWYHVAISRIASQTKMFLNGTQVGSTYADTNSYLCGAGAPWVGSFRDGTGQLNGYIDDLRITKSVGRYQYNFTPPTAEFPNIGGTVTLTADPYYEYTTLLLPGNGTNGAQNNTFLDSSTNAFTITRNGNTTQGTFSPFSQTGWSNYFDGTNDFIYVADSSAFTLGSGDFTVEAWVWTGVTSTQKVISGQIDSLGNVTSLSYQLDISSSDFPRVIVASGSTTYIATSSITLPKNQWVHVAGVRDGSTLRIYVNGTQFGTQSVTGVTVNDSSANVSVGRHGQYAGLDWNGYISNFRLVKGTCVYPSGTTFTPPTTPLTAISGTSLLTCQSNRFVDNSANAFAITANGDVSVQAFSPFNPTASWSAATYGGSGYFDGSGDYLSLADNAAFQYGTGDFTIEFWFYMLATAGSGNYYVLYDGRPSGTSGAYVNIAINNATPESYVSGSIVITGSALSANTWYHFAYARSGTSTKMFVNGTQVGSTYTDTTNYVNGTARPVIGTNGFSVGTSNFNGYFSNYRVVKGTAVYTANFTPPTTPLTAISGTSLLLNFTNAGIYDATSKNDLETVGNAQISTTQSKFGGSSMAFDGTGDYLASNSATTDLYAFGTGDFTIEFWLYLNSTSGTPIIYDGRPSATNGAQPTIYMNGAVITYYTNAANRITGSSLSASTWYHVAVCRYSSATKMFINGFQVGSTYTDSTNYTNTSGRPVIGVDGNSGNTNYFNGYIDDLRITKGIARYTSNFTPPTTAFLTL